MITKNIDVNVETGVILIGDPIFLEKYGGKPKQVIDVDPGLYHIFAKVVGTTSSVKSRMRLSRGMLVVDDPCYAFPDRKKWNNFLDQTKMVRLRPSSQLLIDTGGDGKFVVEVKLKKV